MIERVKKSKWENAITEKNVNVVGIKKTVVEYIIETLVLPMFYIISYQLYYLLHYIKD